MFLIEMRNCPPIVMYDTLWWNSRLITVVISSHVGVLGMVCNQFGYKPTEQFQNLTSKLKILLADKGHVSTFHDQDGRILPTFSQHVQEGSRECFCIEQNCSLRSVVQLRRVTNSYVRPLSLHRSTMSFNAKVTTAYVNSLPGLASTYV